MSAFTFDSVSESTESQSPASQYDTVPERLRELDQWVVRDGKQPCYPSYNWVDDTGEPVTTSFTDALSELETRQSTHKSGTGLGFIVSESDDVVVIDHDDVLTDDGDLFHPSQQILDTCQSWTEKSQSGTGLHTFVRGSDALLDDRADCREFDETHGGMEPHIDLFGNQEARHIALTGDVFMNEPLIRHEEFVRVLHEQFPEQTETLSESTETVGTGEPVVLDDDESDYTVADVRATVETYAEYGSGGSQTVAQQTLALWDTAPVANPMHTSQASETVGAESYTSPSETDWDFAEKLAYYCQGNAQLVRDCWRDSARWTRPTKSKPTRYKRRTVQRACQSQSSHITDSNIVTSSGGDE